MNRFSASAFCFFSHPPPHLPSPQAAPSAPPAPPALQNRTPSAAGSSISTRLRSGTFRHREVLHPPRDLKTTAPANAISTSASACKATRACKRSANLSSATTPQTKKWTCVPSRAQSRRHNRDRRSRCRKRNDGTDRARRARLHRLQGKTHHGSGLRPGDTLEYRIATQIVTPFAPKQFWFEHNFLEGAIVLDEQLELNIPRGRANQSAISRVSIRKGRFQATEPFIAGNTQISTRHADDDERKKPTEAEREATGRAATTFTNWDEVARWYSRAGKRPHRTVTGNPSKTAGVDPGACDRTRKNPGTLRLRLEKHPLRQPFVRSRALPAARGGGSFHESIWRLQRQAHPARRNARCRRDSLLTLC